MDLTLRLQSNRINTHTLLADRLQGRQKSWLNTLRYSPLSQDWSALNALTTFVTEKLECWQRLPVLLQENLSYPWGWLQVNPFPLLHSLRVRLPERGGEAEGTEESDRSPVPFQPFMIPRDRPIEPTLQRWGDRPIGLRKPSSIPTSGGFSSPTDIQSPASHPLLLLPLNRLVSPPSVGVLEPILIRLVQPWIPRFSQPVDLPASPFPSESVTVESPRPFESPSPVEWEPTQPPTLSTISLPQPPQQPSPQVPPVKPPTLHPLTAGVLLEPALRSHLEQRMGFDLDSVRVHADSTAASLADQLQANAFTVGPRIFFAAGKFQPQTRAGIALLVHELTHVRQQLSQLPLRRGQLTLTQRQTLEQEAHAQEQAVLRGEPLSASDDSPSSLSPVNLFYREFSGLAALPQAQGGLSPSLILSDRQQTIPVIPLRQEATTTPSEATPAPATPPGTPLPAPTAAGADPEKLAQQVYTLLQRRLRLEREQGGIQRWH